MRPILIATILVGAAAAAQAQTPPPKPDAPPTAAAPAPAPPEPESYSYSPDGRRDPFTSLLGTGGGDMRAASSRRTDGPGSMLVGDISVRGILQSRGALLAMIQGPDNRTYIVHAGDKLLDGTIKTITPQGLVLLQDVNDPLSLVKQREVSKLLRTLEAGKP